MDVPSKSDTPSITFAPLLSPPLVGLGVNPKTLHLPLPIPREKLTLIGHSRAADATAFYIPELSIYLDAGAKVHTSRPTHVFITHGHSDHSYSMTGLVSRAKPPTVYIPADTAPLLEGYLFASQQLSNAAPMTVEEYDTNHIIKGVQAGETFSLGGKAGYEVDVITCDHSCPCVGYLFYKTTTPLKAEYRGLPGKELKRLKDTGTEITESVRQPLFAFLGDTTAATMAESPEWLVNMPVVVTECTFLEEKHRANAEKTKHTLWTDLEPVVRRHPNTTFILTHFSHQYNDTEVVDFFGKLESPPVNIVVWISQS